MATSSFPRLLPGAQPRVGLLGGGREIWHKSAPSAIARALDWGDDTAGWKAWREYLIERSAPSHPAELVGDPAAYSWGWPERGPSSPLGLGTRIAKLLPSKRTQPELGEELRYWLADASTSRRGAGRALDSICWCWHLPALSKRVSAALWWTLLNRLVESSHNASKQSLDDAPASHQILAGELPLTLAYLFPELKVCRQLATPARQALTSGLEQLLDDGGYLHGRHWGQLGLLLASWTRSRAIGMALRRGSWEKVAQERFSEAIMQLIRAMRGDGTPVLVPACREAWPATFWETALRGVNNPMASKLAAKVLPQRAYRGKGRDASRGKLPDSAAQTDPSRLALMRARWRRQSELLAIEYSGASVQSELVLGCQPLWSGTWGLDVEINGAPAVSISPWESVCWVSDKEVIYFELEMAFAGGVRVQRQMLLARRDRFALMADTILGREPADLVCRTTLPLTKDAVARDSSETRELVLDASAGRIRAIPCALGEWKSDTRGGSLEIRDGNLVLERQARGVSLLSPLLIDLDPRRRRLPLTWRSLTVAENRSILPPDVAAGYRVQIGRQQWLLYRATASRAGRTVLGANTWSQFLLMRIKPSGRLVTLLEIE